MLRIFFGLRQRKKRHVISWEQRMKRKRLQGMGLKNLFLFCRLCLMFSNGLQRRLMGVRFGRSLLGLTYPIIFPKETLVGMVTYVGHTL